MDDLFYARSSAVEQDYFVRETTLEEPVRAVLRRHARQFIAHRVAMTLDGLDLTVFTDRKWLEFILTQILTNAVRYRREGLPRSFPPIYRIDSATLTRSLTAVPGCGPAV